MQFKKDRSIVQFPNSTLERMNEKFVGKKYNNVEILEVLGKKNNKGGALVKALCICGKSFVCCAYDIIRAHTKSCGCLKKICTKNINTTHGASTKGHVDPEYKVWSYMKDKILNKSEKGNKKYAKRKERLQGIGICDRWLEKKKGYENFIEDMGKKPSKESILRRKDASKGFEKDNCYWKNNGDKEEGNA